MLRTLRDLESYKIEATDGDIGRVCDFCFDDETWGIRYLVTDTGGFWDGPHRVLISPLSFRQADWSMHRFHLAITRDKIEHSPNVDTDKTVTRQFELDYAKYYGWAPYFGTWGLTSAGSSLAVAFPDERPAGLPSIHEIHLRSTQAVTGYQINSGKHVLGFVTDFIVDDETWTIRYLVVETHKWWFGKKVLLSPRWVRSMSWSERTLHTDIPREKFKGSPAWTAGDAVNRSYEQRLYDYHGQPAYWIDVLDGAGDAPPPVEPNRTWAR